MKNLILLLTLTFISVPAFAAMDMHLDHKMDHKKPFMHHQNEAGTMTEPAQAYTHINHTMHENMMIEFTGNADIDFLKGMIPHHQGAIDMANIQLMYGKDGLLKSFTQRVIRDQNREIGYMKSHLKALESAPDTDTKNGLSTLAFKRVNKNMHTKMGQPLNGNADIDFVQGMIPHHQGAVDMAEVVLRFGNDAYVRRIANEIINAQESEMTWMNRWLSRQRLMRMF